MTSTGSGRKRYNVPSDIELSLENLSQQACSVVAVELEDVQARFPDTYKQLCLAPTHQALVGACSTRMVVSSMHRSAKFQTPPNAVDLL